MEYNEVRKFQIRDQLVMKITGVDTVDVPKLSSTIINLLDRIEQLEYELKNVKHDMSVMNLLYKKNKNE